MHFVQLIIQTKKCTTYIYIYIYIYIHILLAYMEHEHRTAATKQLPHIINIL